jgi:hypothetical protein
VWPIHLNMRRLISILIYLFWFISGVFH